MGPQTLNTMEMSRQPLNYYAPVEALLDTKISVNIQLVFLRSIYGLYQDSSIFDDHSVILGSSPGNWVPGGGFESRASNSSVGGLFNICQ